MLLIHDIPHLKIVLFCIWRFTQRIPCIFVLELREHLGKLRVPFAQVAWSGPALWHGLLTPCHWSLCGVYLLLVWGFDTHHSLWIQEGYYPWVMVLIRFYVPQTPQDDFRIFLGRQVDINMKNIRKLSPL